MSKKIKSKKELKPISKAQMKKIKGGTNDTVTIIIEDVTDL